MNKEKIKAEMEFIKKQFITIADNQHYFNERLNKLDGHSCSQQDDLSGYVDGESHKSKRDECFKNPDWEEYVKNSKWTAKGVYDVELNPNLYPTTFMGKDIKYVAKCIEFAEFIITADILDMNIAETKQYIRLKDELKELTRS